jgi:hypothetical protein
MEGLVLRKGTAPIIHTDESVDLDDMFKDEDEDI